MTVKEQKEKYGLKMQILCWVIFAVMYVVGYMYQPDTEDPSIVITFGALSQLFAVSLLWMVPRAGVRGDCVEFCMLLIVALAMRLAVTTRYNGYLPTDWTGDGLYQGLEAVTAIVAFRGLVRTGLTKMSVFKTICVVGIAAAGSYYCYGFLNQRKWADCAFATSVYTESMAWLFLAKNLVSAGKKRDISASFLLPSVASAACRTYFWYLAAEEIAPPKPVLMMEHFPAVLVLANVVITVIPFFTFLLLALTPAEEQPLQVVKGEVAEPLMQAPVVPVVAAPAPLMAAAAAIAPSVVPSVAGLPSLPAPKGAGCKEFAPVRAVYENGVLRVQYQPFF